MRLAGIMLAIFAAFAIAGLVAASDGDFAVLGVAALPLVIYGLTRLFKQPFVGIWTLVFISQLDAIAVLAFRAVSEGSPIKALTAVTLAAALYRYRIALVDRLLANEPFVSRFLLLLLGAILISALFARDGDLAQDEIRRMFNVVVLVVLIGGAVVTLKQVEWLVLALMGSTLLSALLVVYDWRTGGASFLADLSEARSTWQNVHRSSGGSLDGAPMAATMLLCGTTLSVCLALRTARWRMLTVPTALLGSFAITLTLTRSATLTFVLLLVWMAWKIRHQRSFIYLVLAGLTLCAVMLPLLPAEFWDKISTLSESDRDGTLLRRLSYHVIGADLLLEYPLTGVGVGNFAIYYGDFENRFVPGRSELRPLHNQYLQYAVEAGILGGIAYIGLLATVFMSFLRTSRQALSPDLRLMAEALLFSFTGLCVQMVYLSSKFNKYLWIYIGLAIAVRALFNEEKNNARTSGGS
jgi:O-antigen ligase